MKLYISLTSPFAHKVRMVVLEKGLAGKVDNVPVIPWDNPPGLVDKNPLGQVPVLVLDDGEAVFDSRVICAYLDQLASEPQLLPASGFDRTRVMRMEALADGMTDAAVAVFVARKANAEEPDTPQIERQLGKITDSLDVMQTGLPSFERELNLGKIAYAATLAYLDFRFDELNWRSRVPQLAGWFGTFAAWPSMIETVPQV